uniref:Uncharacterized protein n=1 Tax=Aegilops tauschii subsp. strangulata TaxID=200361 RepID=A0A453KJW2_AEGTS
MFSKLYITIGELRRERWQKPILRRLQPPPPVNDTNPYNVFRPREKAHRLHTRRMQRRENNIQSFEKLRLVRRNLDQAKALMGALIKREETKREVMECEVNLQRVQMQYKSMRPSLLTMGLHCQGSSKLLAGLGQVMMIMRIQMTPQLKSHIFGNLFSIIGTLITSSRQSLHCV